MINFLYTHRFYFVIFIGIFAAQGFQAFYQGQLLAGSVIGSMAILVLGLLLFIITRASGTIFNKDTALLIILIPIEAVVYIGLLAFATAVGL